MSDLGELGLSSYEEGAYRALLSLGSATARGVSDASGVPMGRIYDVLNGLDARDLVRTQSTDPRTYVAIDPDAAVDRLLAERKRELEARAERYERVADAVGTELAATTPAESRFWTAPLGSDAAVTLTRELFETAGETVSSAMSVPYATAPWPRYEPEVDPFFDAVGDGVGAKVLASAAMLERVPAEVRRAYLDAPESLSLRVTTDLEVTFDVVDGNEVCVHVPHPLDRTERLGVIHVRDAAMAGRLENVFERAWADATPVEAAVDDRGDGSV